MCFLFLSYLSLLPLVLETSSLFRAVCSLFSKSLVSLERFAPCVSLFHTGLLLVLKYPSLFRAVCSLFSHSLVSFERCVFLSFSSCLLFRLKISILFRAVCSLSLSFLSLSLFVLKTSSLFGAVRSCLQFILCLCSGLLLLLVFSERVCSSCSSSLVSLERFAPCSARL